jgi:osmotically-inducible protein OsmY
MKTDNQLRQDVLDELSWNPSINEKAIGVAVKDGVVILAGAVDSYAQKLSAEYAAERVSGVRAIADDLTVRVLPSVGRSDGEIAKAAVTSLDWHVEVPAKDLKVIVDNGWVTMEGKVQWQFQRAAAERAVRYLAGVRGVTNLIAVTPTVASPLEVSAKIREALRRGAAADANRVIVEAVGGKVTLRGSVRSFAEREDAERAAWGAPGVTEVEDRILVGA